MPRPEPNDGCVETELKFDKITDRIAMFESYTVKNKEVSNYSKPPESNHSSLLKQHGGKSGVPPPRTPPPADYVKDNFSASNYFSLPRNSRIFFNDQNYSATMNNKAAQAILKSSSFSNFSRISNQQVQQQSLEEEDWRNKLSNSVTFDKYIKTRVIDEQQKTNGRIIG